MYIGAEAKPSIAESCFSFTFYIMKYLSHWVISFKHMLSMFTFTKERCVKLERKWLLPRVGEIACEALGTLMILP